MELPIAFPCGWHVNFQWSALYAADVLLHRLQRPRNRQPVTKEGGRYAGSQNGGETWDMAPQFVEHGNDLGGVSEAMAGNGAPDRRQG